MDDTVVIVVVSALSLLCRDVVDRQMVLRASVHEVLLDCPKIRFAISVTSSHRQTTKLTHNDTNDTNKASKLCMTLRVGADVGHHDEAQHDHDDDDVCCAGDGPEIATGTGIETNTHNMMIG